MQNQKFNRKYLLNKGQKSFSHVMLLRIWKVKKTPTELKEDSEQAFQTMAALSASTSSKTVYYSPRQGAGEIRIKSNFLLQPV